MLLGLLLLLSPPPCSVASPPPPQPVSLLGQNSASLPWRWSQPPQHTLLSQLLWVGEPKGDAAPLPHPGGLLQSACVGGSQVLRIIQGQRSSPQLCVDLIFPHRSYFSCWCRLWFFAVLMGGKMADFFFNLQELCRIFFNLIQFSFFMFCLLQ